MYAEVFKTLESLERSRLKCVSEGNYAENIKVFEHSIRQITKYINSSSSSDRGLNDRLQDLRAKLQLELKILVDIQSELDLLSTPRQTRGVSSNGLDSHGPSASDPDIWPPPTPNANGRDLFNENGIMSPSRCQ